MSNILNKADQHHEQISREIKDVPGLDPVLGQALLARGVRKIVDLGWYLPRKYLVRMLNPPVADFSAGQNVILRLEAQSYEQNTFSRFYTVKCIYRHPDGHQAVNIISIPPRRAFSDKYYAWVKKNLPLDEERFVAGTLRLGSKQQWQIVNPAYVDEQADSIPLVEPVYPVVKKMSNRQVCKKLQLLLEQLPELPEWHSEELLAKHQWPGWRDAVKLLHCPQPGQVDYPHPSAKQRLVYDELTAHQLAIGLHYSYYTSTPQVPLAFPPELLEQLLNYLPFRLRPEQMQVFQDVSADLTSTKPMLRVLSGEVGSGKTVIAFLAALALAALGKQTVILAPTTILARQHYENLLPLAKRAQCQISYLASSLTAKQANATLDQIRSGTTKIIVGTHALLSKRLSCHDLRLLVIDEQQRFGVLQRSALCRKGGVDLLMMTATPIPRTQVLLEQGYMKLSSLEGVKHQRHKVQTTLLVQDRWEQLVKRLKIKLRGGTQIYWICPVVKTKKNGDLRGVEERVRQLRAALPGYQIGMLHGQMPDVTKRQIMQSFGQGQCDVLVTTTVIEVGVDIPRANLMVIENAERFGLVQLHQLRGRIGRDVNLGHCILLAPRQPSQTARARLLAMKACCEGKLIAQSDLATRGQGDLHGAQQSGDTKLRIASTKDAQRYIPEVLRQVHRFLDRESPLDKNNCRSQLLSLFNYRFHLLAPEDTT